MGQWYGRVDHNDISSFISVNSFEEYECNGYQSTCRGEGNGTVLSGAISNWIGNQRTRDLGVGQEKYVERSDDRCRNY